MGEFVLGEAPATKSLSAWVRQRDLRGAAGVADIDLPRRVSVATESASGLPGGYARRQGFVPTLTSVPDSSPN